MERIEYRGVVDKTGWPRGVWDDEPDKIQWRDEVTGMPCLIVRGPSGSLCGYVGVSHGHEMYGKDYDNAINLDVHGGITFANACSPHGHEEHGVCHKVEPGEDDDVWWLGFDCAHAFDLCPRYERYHTESRASGREEVYRDIAYVEGECRSLAEQLSGTGQGHGDGALLAG